MNPDRTALVTGSASGIGYEMAFLLARKGYQLYLVDINKEGLEKVSREIAAAYPVTVIHNCIDLSLPDAAQSVYADCCERRVDVEVLISNAGFFFFSEIAESDPEKAARLIRLHVQTPSMLAIYFSKEMKQKRRGYIYIDDFFCFRI
jgi:short-subunit dehydrogenase